MEIIADSHRAVATVEPEPVMPGDFTDSGDFAERSRVDRGGARIQLAAQQPVIPRLGGDGTFPEQSVSLWEVGSGLPGATPVSSTFERALSGEQHP
ncbi:hypothetical protein [Nocardia abscessus]|uniref:hypothetical protein n=1 Tax=Nocardia abscessus TaxID=120957 RepID=UPI0012FBF5E2|nr:hypothetical protein [Nocardia abscessus]MCC3332261.1 hypothetical protein [Nocardia abscessus]